MMTTSWRAGVLALALMTSGLTQATAVAKDWAVDQKASSLTFALSQGGAAIKGTFQSWSADIHLDPADLSDAKITVKVDLKSARTGDASRDTMLQGGDWFNTGAAAEATFAAEKVTKGADGTYQAAGTLSLKGVSKPLTLTFSLDVDGKAAKAEGKGMIARLDYDLGKAVPPASLEANVTVSFSVNATEK